ncbi:MAG: hypothetical protein AB7P20_12790 [Rhizobiaceae bacterium]
MAKHLLENLIKWSQREQWNDHCDIVFDEFFSELLADYDIDFEKAASLLGETKAMAVWGCYFEAAVTQPCEASDEGSIVGDYLKRRGWKEPASVRRYMKALGDSVLSLHEVVDSVPGESLNLKDVLLGGEPITVVERSASRSLNAGDFLAARVIPLESRFELSGGLLRVAQQMAQAITSNMSQAFEAIESGMAQAEDLDGLTPDEASELGKRVFLDTQAMTIVQLWLDEELSRHIDKLPPPSVNDDGEPLVFVRMSYPLLSEANAEVVEQRLDRAPFLIEGSEADWYWLNEGDVSEDRQGMAAAGYRNRERFILELEDGTQALGRLELLDDMLDVAVNSKRRADRIQLLLAPILAGLIGPVSVDERTLDQLFDGADDDLSADAPSTGLVQRRAS